MSLKLLTEITDGGKHGIGSGLPQTAMGGFLDMFSKLFEVVDILDRSLATDDPVKNIEHHFHSDPAGNALSTGFVDGEVREKPGRINHAGQIVHDHESAGTHHRSCIIQGVEVHFRVQKEGGQARSGRPANLHSLILPFIKNSSSDIKDNLSQGCAHGDFDQPNILHGACQGKHFGSLRP